MKIVTPSRSIRMSPGSRPRPSLPAISSTTPSSASVTAAMSRILPAVSMGMRIGRRRRLATPRLDLATDELVGSLPVGCFGASTGAAAALVAAAERPRRVRAVVSRGGRPDLAADALPRVTAPTLLIVGGRDPEVLRLNQQAQKLLAAESRLEVVPGATHLFEEPAALEQVTTLARDWFVRHLPEVDA